MIKSQETCLHTMMVYQQTARHDCLYNEGPYTCLSSMVCHVCSVRHVLQQVADTSHLYSEKP